MARPASLSLAMPKSRTAVSSAIASPLDARRNSSSSSVALRNCLPNGDEGVDLLIPSRDSTRDNQPHSPELTSLPPFPASPRDAPRHVREPSKGFFSNLKASKSSNKVYRIEPTIRQVSEDTPRSNTDLSGNTIYSLRKTPGSTPDLSLSSSIDTSSMDDRGDEQGQGSQIPRRPVGISAASDSMISSSPSEASNSKKPKPRLKNLLTRTRSMRMDEVGRKSKPSTPISTPVQITAPEIRMQPHGTGEEDDHRAPPNTAPLRQDQSYRDIMGSSTRNRSADRQLPSSHGQENVPSRRNDKTSTQGLSASSSGGSREGGGSHLFSNIKNSSSKAADGLGKAGKSIFGKVARSGSSNTKEEGRYVHRVINLPLIQQTRKTRIASRLADSRDKTEFWMPALPWRCIDFLNLRGCEEEGLYRVPGSELQIRHWQKRFDQEGDIDLLEEKELYDVNIIGSMFKTWLRELPDEIMPKATQARIARECAGATECPQLLKDELSSLPPWNYYLLFAITCHLSLLVVYADQNKMGYNNLCVCFQPCLRIDSFCFQFLVQEWRNCWQGCWTEKAALEDEYHILNGGQASHDSGGETEGEHSPGSTAVAEDQSHVPPSNFQPTLEAYREKRVPASSISPHSATDKRSMASSTDRNPSIGGRIPQSKPSPRTFPQPDDAHLSTIYSEYTSTPTNSSFRREGEADSDITENDSSMGGGHTTSHTPLPELAPVQPLSPIVHHFH